ncbi:hypothetical protein [Mesorhizobium sp.]|nr:hypothetical protein [Mesorhizobium sp.]
MRIETSILWRRLDQEGHDAVLTVSPAGFVVDYPGLWRSSA